MAFFSFLCLTYSIQIRVNSPVKLGVQIAEMILNMLAAPPLTQPSAARSDTPHIRCVALEEGIQPP